MLCSSADRNRTASRPLMKRWSADRSTFATDVTPAIADSRITGANGMGVSGTATSAAR